MSMRGFGYRRLSPLAAVVPAHSANIAENLETVPIGGNALALGNLEARLAVTDTLIVATFYDAGSITSGTWSQELFDSFYHAVGIGLRYLTPVGAIRLDVGRRFAGRGHRDVTMAADIPGGMPNFIDNTSCFGIGGNAGSGVVLSDGLCQLHLSIGEAF